MNKVEKGRNMKGARRIALSLVFGATMAFVLHAGASIANQSGPPPVAYIKAKGRPAISIDPELVPDGTVIRGTSKLPDGNCEEVAVGGTIPNEGKKPVTVRVSWEFTDDCDVLVKEVRVVDEMLKPNPPVDAIVPIRVDDPKTLGNRESDASGRQ